MRNPTNKNTTASPAFVTVGHEKRLSNVQKIPVNH